MTAAAQMTTSRPRGTRRILSDSGPALDFDTLRRWYSRTACRWPEGGPR